MIAVDDDQIVLPDQRARLLHADRRRNAEAARDDRRVRRAAAEVRHEALERLRLELQHVGGRDVVRDDDHLVMPVAGRAVHDERRRRRRARQRLQHALDDLLDVGLAFAQIFVFDVVEMAAQDFELLGQRPFHVVAARADEVDGFLHEHGVVQDHRMDVDERAHFARGVGGEVVAQGVEFRVHGLLRRVKALDFRVDPVGLDQVMVDVERRGRDQIRTPDGDAA